MLVKNRVSYLSVFAVIKEKTGSREIIIIMNIKYRSLVVCCQCPFIRFEMLSLYNHQKMKLILTVVYSLTLH